MARSVREDTAVLVTFEIRVNGKSVSDDIQVHAIEVERALNRIPSAIVTIADGLPAEANFPVSETTSFVPGSDIEILLGYEGKNTPVFKGIILGLGIRVGSTGESHLELTCRDRAVAATVARRTIEYREMTDGEAIAAALNPFGVTVQAASTPVRHAHLIQNRATAWDFAITRAQANGMNILVEDGRVKVAAPNFDSAALAAAFGDTIISLDLEMSALNQPGSVTAEAWDPKTQHTETSTAAEPRVNKQGDLPGSKLAQVLDVKDVTLTSQGWLEADMRKAWASGTLLRARLSRIRGRLTVPGNAGLAPDTLLDLAGLGKRFNGAGYVSALRHVVVAGDWHSEVTLGLPADSFSESHRDITGPPAAGLSPGTTGLQIGTVKQVYEDPKSEYRVLVILPMTGESGAAGVWARYAAPYASDKAGIAFLPEVGDEVVLGFLGGDPAAPMILGALHSSKRAAPEQPDKENKVKAIVTRSQLKMTFDDTDKIIGIETPDGHKLTLSDKDKSIEVLDSNGNTVKLSESGIAVSSPKDVSISAEGSVSISGASGVTLSSPADVSVSGSNVSATADMSFSAEGSASASLTATGEVTIQGLMVNIN